ncbi:MAG TPA: c-type cytochrome biogenesis protein CcmI [Azospirillaceae bacterium]|nr:c-type cytochrome biogenesis protein CcmI [Azospirillaceae bacterium]
MLFWIAAAGLTAASAFVLARPLLKSSAPLAARADYDLEVYRHQLAELEREQERGLISPQQAASAKAEIGRRMLAVSAAQEKAQNEKAQAGKDGKAAAARPGSSRLAAIAVIAMLPLGALAVYLPLGQPDLPARPYALRDLDKERNAPPESVLTAVAKLKEELAANPDNLQGWTILARAMARMGEWQEAAAAFKQVVRLAPDDIDVKAAYAETLVNVAGGKIGPDALKILREVQAAAPKDPRALYYLALARSQDGDLKGALEDWRTLVAATPADAPWLPVVKARIEETASKLGLDIASVMPQPLPAAEPKPASPEQEAAERQKLIDGMVRQLESKLAANPDDVDGWVRLARSYRVLGQNDKAVNAAQEAVKRGPNQATAHLALADALLGGMEDPPSPLPEAAAAALKQALALDSANRDALWLLGTDAAKQGRKDEAAALWGRLLAQLDAGSPDHAFVKERIDGLK